MKKKLLILGFSIISYAANAQIDYNSEIQPIFTNNCISCHGGTNGVTLSSYSEAINSMGLQYDTNVINPGNANNSPIVDKIDSNNPQFGSRMPKGGQLSTDEINKIKQWINEGALEEVATSNEDEITAPTEFKLLGNYPNPFNPTTTIQFQVPVSSNFQITVYNANGQLLASINGKASAGIKSQSIDLTNQASGVYFYRVKAIFKGVSSFIGSGKMTLIK